MDAPSRGLNTEDWRGGTRRVVLVLGVMGLMILAVRILFGLFRAEMPQLAGRDLLHYDDLAFYISQADELLHGKALSARYIMNPLWSLIVYAASAVLKSTWGLSALAMGISLLRDLIVIFIAYTIRPKRLYLVGFLLAIAPYLMVYSYNFTADLVVSLYIAFVLLAVARRGSLSAERWSVRINVLVIAGVAMIFVKAVLLPVVVLTYVMSVVSFRRAERRTGRERFLFAAASLLLLCGVLLYVKISLGYFDVFVKTSSDEGFVSFGSLLKFFQGLAGDGRLSKMLAIVGTPIVHLVSFVCFREGIYLGGFRNPIDVAVMAVLLVTCAPAVWWFIRNPLSIPSIIFIVLFVPSAYGFAHARYSFPIQPFMIWATVCMVRRAETGFEGYTLMSMLRCMRRKDAGKKASALGPDC